MGKPAQSYNGAEYFSNSVVIMGKQLVNLKIIRLLMKFADKHSHLISFLTHKGQLVTLQGSKKKKVISWVKDGGLCFTIKSLCMISLTFSPGGPGRPVSPCQNSLSISKTN